MIFHTATYPLGLYLAVVFCALAGAWALTPLCRALALRAGIVDRPDANLKTHGEPMPYLGGLAVLGGLGLGLMAYALLPGPTLADPDRQRLAALLLGTLLMALLGLWDDRRNLSPWTKLAVQTLIALPVALWGVRMQLVWFPDWLNLLLTVLWLVGMSNALNLVDIMDGMAAGVAGIAGLLFFLLAVTTPLYDKTFVAMPALALAGACGGFLRFNFAPARIYLGDMGALALGFLLGALAIGESYTSTTLFGLLAPLLVLAIPLYDTFYVIVLRLLAGKSILRGSRDHVALRLRALGLSVRQTVTVCYAASLLFGGGALVLALSSGTFAAVLAATLVLLAVAAGVALSRVKMP